MGTVVPWKYHLQYYICTTRRAPQLKAYPGPSSRGLISGLSQTHMEAAGAHASGPSAEADGSSGPAEPTPRPVRPSGSADLAATQYPALS